MNVVMEVRGSESNGSIREQGWMEGVDTGKGREGVLWSPFLSMEQPGGDEVTRAWPPGKARLNFL